MHEMKIPGTKRIDRPLRFYPSQEAVAAVRREMRQLTTIPLREGLGELSDADVARGVGRWVIMVDAAKLPAPEPYISLDMLDKLLDRAEARVLAASLHEAGVVHALMECYWLRSDTVPHKYTPE